MKKIAHHDWSGYHFSNQIVLSKLSIFASNIYANNDIKKQEIFKTLIHKFYTELSEPRALS